MTRWASFYVLTLTLDLKKRNTMITIHITCSCCGKEFPHVLSVAHPNEFTEKFIWYRFPSGWLMEENGKNLDIYCSKKCAQGLT